MSEINENIWINLGQGMELEPNNNVGHNTTSENAILFYVEYLILKEKLGELTKKDLETFDIITNNLRTWCKSTQLLGLFDRRQDESIIIQPKSLLRLISHDNLTAISSFSLRHNLKWSRHMAKHMLKNLFRTDNAYPENPRWLFRNEKGKLDTSFQWHPRDWFYWLYAGRGIYRLLSYPIFPIYFLAQVFSYRNPKEITSTKLLGFVRCYNTNKSNYLLRFTWFFCEKLLKRQYGNNYISSLMKIYFKHEEHPNRMLAKEVEDG